eukprot:1172381-Pyramimonas_sp.AAC.1
MYEPSQVGRLDSVAVLKCKTEELFLLCQLDKEFFLDRREQSARRSANFKYMLEFANSSPDETITM